MITISNNKLELITQSFEGNGTFNTLMTSKDIAGRQTYQNCKSYAGRDERANDAESSGRISEKEKVAYTDAILELKGIG